MNKGKLIDANKLKKRIKKSMLSDEARRYACDIINELSEEEKESEVACNFNIISDEVEAEYLRHRVKWLEIHNAALCKELIDIKLKLKDLSK